MFKLKSAAEKKVEKEAKDADNAAKDAKKSPPARIKSGRPGDRPEDLREELDRGSAHTPEKVEKGDYLWKYEFHQKSGYPYFLVPNMKYTAPSPGSKAEKMKKFLLSQPKVRVFVPRMQNESPKVLQVVNLNGYRLEFPKNTYIDMPEQIAEVLRRSLQQTEDALGQFRVDRDPNTEQMLG